MIVKRLKGFTPKVITSKLNVKYVKYRVSCFILDNVSIRHCFKQSAKKLYVMGFVVGKCLIHTIQI